MKQGSPKRYRNVLRLLGWVALLVYVAFLVSEFSSGMSGNIWESITTGLLFIVFLVGLFYLFNKEWLTGILWIAWYGFLLLLVLTVWDGAGVTVIMGLPILVLGVLVFIYGVRHLKKPQVT